MKIHELKTWPEYFERVVSGNKAFEVRKNDRNFQVGDLLILKEWNPDVCEYTGNKILLNIDYLLQGAQFGIEYGYCVMSISKNNQ